MSAWMYIMAWCFLLGWIIFDKMTEIRLQRTIRRQNQHTADNSLAGFVRYWNHFGNILVDYAPFVFVTSLNQHYNETPWPRILQTVTCHRRSRLRPQTKICRPGHVIFLALQSILPFDHKLSHLQLLDLWVHLNSQVLEMAQQLFRSEDSVTICREYMIQTREWNVALYMYLHMCACVKIIFVSEYAEPVSTESKWSRKAFACEKNIVKTIFKNIDLFSVAKYLLRPDKFQDIIAYTRHIARILLSLSHA